MNNYKILLLLFIPCLMACDLDFTKNRKKLSKQKVYEIADDANTEMNNFNSHSQIEKDTSYIAILFENFGLVNITDLDSTIKVDLRYADTNNFLGLDFYDGLKSAYLNCEAAIKLCNAQHYLKDIRPDYSLIIFDASRPLHIQQMMWDSLKMPDLKKYQYLSPPTEPSLHNYGCAVDVSILDIKNNRILDMGSEFDHFGKLSEPAKEKDLLNAGVLSKNAYENRLLLRNVMKMAKYNPITTEWWHFSICTKPEAAKKFQLIP